MEAPSAGPAHSAWGSVVGPGWLLAGAELEVVIHGDVRGQHLQVQGVGVLQGTGGVRRSSLGLQQTWGGGPAPSPPRCTAESRSPRFSFCVCEMGIRTEWWSGTRRPSKILLSWDPHPGWSPSTVTRADLVTTGDLL